MKRLIVKLSAMVMLLAISLNASAYDFEVDGVYYNIFSVSDKTCKISGVSDKSLTKFEIPSTVEYNTQQLKVVGLESEAFKNCSNLAEVTFPRTLTLKIIGISAFKGCSSLKELNIPQSVTNIEGHFFQNCENLESITFSTYSPFKWIEGSIVKNDSILIAGNNNGVIPQNVKVIGNAAFLDCTLSSIDIGDNITSIGSYAFSGCSKLSSVNFGKNITLIGRAAFKDCIRLSKVNLSKNIKTIENSVFSGCISLSTVNIEDSTEPLGVSYDLFKECPLDYVYVGRNLEYYESGFQSYSPFMNSNLKKVTLGSFVTKIPTSLFMKCYKLEKCEILGQIESTGLYIFWSCRNLAEFPFNDSNCIINRIEEASFDYCKSLSKIVLPKTITHLGAHCFRYCGTIEYLYVNPALSYLGSTTSFQECSVNTLVIGDSETPFRMSANGLLIESIYLGRKTTIEDLNPTYIKYLRYGDVFETVENLNKYNTLTRLDLGANVKTLEYETFKSNYGLRSIISRNPTPPSNAKFSDEVYVHCVVQVPKGSLNAYKADKNWSNFWNIQEVSEFSEVENVITDSMQLINVYTLNGVLVRKSVKRDEATQGLPQGVYIVGGEKVIVM